MSAGETLTGADEHVRSTFKHGAVYLVGTVLSRIAGFVMLPIYTRVLTARDYGIMEMLGYTTDVLTFLVGLGVSTAVIRHYYKFESDRERNEVISTAAILLLCLFTVVGVPLTLFAERATQILLGPGEPAVYLRLSVVVLVLGVAIDVPMTVLRARQRSSAVVVAGGVRLLLAVGFNLIFVVWLRMGVLGVLISTIMASALVGGILLVRLLSSTGMRFSPPIARQLIAFGAPFAISQLGAFILHFSDRYFLRAFDTLDTVGVYAVSYKVAMVIPILIAAPFASVWLPKALEIHQAEGARAVPVLTSIASHYRLLLVAVACGAALFAEDAIRIAMGDSFQGAYGPIPVLTVAMVFFGYRQVAQIGLLITDKPALVARSTSIAAGLVLLLNLLLIPRWGAMGAAWATLGGFATEFVVMRWFSMRAYGMRVAVGALPLAVAVVAWSAARWAIPQQAPLPMTLAINAAGFLLFVAGLAATGAMDASQRHFIVRLIRDPRETVRTLRAA